MEIKLSIQEVVLLQKINRAPLSLKEILNNESTLEQFETYGLCEMVPISMYESVQLQITDAGKKVLQKHLPIIVRDSDITVPQSYKG